MIPYATSIKYMIGGYSAIFIMLAIYLVSLVLRWRRMKRDLHLLEAMKDSPKEVNKSQ